MTFKKLLHLKINLLAFFRNVTLQNFLEMSPLFGGL